MNLAWVCWRQGRADVPAVLACMVSVLVEVPVMFSVCEVCNGTRACGISAAARMRENQQVGPLGRVSDSTAFWSR